MTRRPWDGKDFERALANSAQKRDLAAKCQEKAKLTVKRTMEIEEQRHDEVMKMIGNRIT